MEKRIETILSNGRDHDCVINHCMRPIRDELGQIVYTNKEENIAKCQGYVSDICMYIKESNTNKVVAVSISPKSIKKLIEAIMEIEHATGEEFWDA